METNEKVRFFAQYWGQIVALITKGSYTHPLGTLHVVNSQVVSNTSSIAKHRYSLLLKPLSSISEEDAYKTVRIARPDVIWENYSKDAIESFALTFSHSDVMAYQHLQSKGYALFWNQYSVTDLETMGWIKLTPTK